MESYLGRLNITNDELKPSLPNHDDSPSSGQNSNATLDSLSVELKVAILQYSPDTRTLRALVRSSPLYHGAYANHRQSILSTVLLRDLGPRVFSEALSLHEASKIPWEDASAPDFRSARKEGVEALIAQYRDRRETPPQLSQITLNMESLESLVRFQSIVNETTSDFCRSRLSQHPITCDRFQSYEEPSSHEKRRIYRAIYRFQLFYTLFNVPLSVGRPPDRSDPSPFDWMDMSHLFLSIFNPWEVEEIACIRDYIMECYDSIFRQCLDFIVKFRPSRESALKSVLIYSYEENCMSLGLPFFRHVLSLASKESQAEILKNHLADSGAYLSEVLGQEPYDYVYSTDAYLACEDQEELRFSNDDVKGPNAAWPWSTDYKVEIDYFQRHKEGFRKWAYVMWDIERLERWNVLEMDVEDVIKNKV